MENAHTLEGAAVCARLSVDPRAGLTPAQVASQQAKFGRNELPPPETTPFYKLVLKQFEDFLVLILLGAAVISFCLALFEEGEDRVTAFVEPAVILCILIANATVGVIQETNAEKSIEALRKSEARDATVLRGGLVQSVPSVELVPGDIIIISVGDKVPADARVLKIETATLSVDEAMLTGESVPAQKGTGVIADVNAVAAERRNMVFSGTLVVRGKATAVVCQTAANTAMGDIASSLSEEEEEKTPLQQKLDEFGELLTKVIGVICVVVWVINIGHFTDPEHGSFVKGAIYYFKIAVALAVAAIPEGLPAVVTTCLALGTMKMAKKNAIVRKLPSVETLGCTTVICSDKTGTLTTNKMSVQHVVVVSSVAAGSAAFREFTVAGDSYAPFGVISDVKGRHPLTLPAVEEPALAEVGKICALCNESDLQYVVEPGKEVGVYSKTGVPTEAALKVLAEKIGVPDRAECDQIFRSRDPFTRVSAATAYWKGLYERERVLEFDRNRKSMSVLVREAESGATVLLVKGAPESILDRCTRVRTSSGALAPLTAQMREQLLFHYNQLAQRGLRCLALSYVTDPDPNSAWGDIERFGDIESDMVFVGLTGMLDPPRAMVNKSIAKCHQAGIRVIVITGDNQATAESICRLIGVFGPSEDVSNKSFTGSEFAAMPLHKQRDVVRHASLFSRVEPRHKHRLVELLKEQGEIVAMTGDGVNDAPALKAAHIGVAMGSGTDVAREASHMVLQDDNFATIVMAVEEGRAIFSNTKQFIRYLISSNIGEVACIFLTAAFGMPEALIPVQLLWVNLVTDGLPATALGFNPPDPDIMLRPPRGQDEGIVNGWMFFRYLAIGLYVGLGTVGGFIWWFLYYPGGPGLSWKQLTEFHSCSRAVAAGAVAGAPASALFPPGFDCTVFHDPRPSSVSLSILVTIEMFNALNALSENQSLLVVPPWSNLWVLVAVALSFALHFVILYVPFFAHVFKVAPLSWDEWQAVLSFSAPVVILDELLKFISRNTSRSRTAPSKKRR